MRSQLFAAGAFSLGLGVFFYVFALPIVFAWSLPFVLSGAFMMLVSPFLKESEGPVRPPEGFQFCVFCSTLVPVGAERCSHCGGRQPLVRR